MQYVIYVKFNKEVFEELIMNKMVVVIGLGGTGLEVIRCLRRIMIEQNDSLSNFPSAGFFYIDTDTTRVVKPYTGDSATGDKNYSSDWSILGKPYHLLEKEYIKVELPVISEMINDNQARQNIEHWFPYEQLRDINIMGHPGAAQIRSLGRLAFYYNYTDIKIKFLNLINSIQIPTNSSELQIYICSSLSGGTGAGMFLDMAYCVKSWLSTDTNVNTFGFLVLPNLTAIRGNRYFANAYAALKELNYFSLNQARDRRTEQYHPIKFSLLNENRSFTMPPFDSCYLIGMSNNTGTQIKLDDAPKMVANRIYLNIDQSFNDAVKGLVQNAHVERLFFLEDPVTGYNHAQNFFSFGLASIIYPHDKVKDLITYRLCSYTINSLLSESKDSSNFHDGKEKFSSIYYELNNLKSRFEEETKRLTRYLTNTDNKWCGNTYTLFEEEMVDDIFKQIINQQVSLELERILSGYDLIRLVNFSNDESIFKTELKNSVIYEEAVKIIESAEINRYLGKNIVQVFMSIYKEPSVRRKILNETYKLADFYYAFDKNEKYKGDRDSSYRADANKMRNIVALAGSEEETPELAEFKKELENARVYLTDDVKIISNPYQMVFLRETSAFPLRLGQDVKVLKEKYDQYLDNNNVPLHISKEFLPPLQELFLSDDDSLD